MSTSDELARGVVTSARERGFTIATGESLTAGALAAEIARVAGASHVLHGGVIAYTPDVKMRLLGVSVDALAHGIVSEPVACEMARGAANRLGTTVGIGTTGVAGPDPHDGAPVGSVWLAVFWRGDVVAQHHQFSGDRESIQAASVRAALELCVEYVFTEQPGHVARPTK